MFCRGARRWLSLPHPSKQHPRMNVGAVHGRVTTGTPAGALLQARRMGSVADVDLARLLLHLRVTFQTEIGVGLYQQLAIDRSVR